MFKTKFYEVRFKDVSSWDNQVLYTTTKNVKLIAELDEGCLYQIGDVFVEAVDLEVKEITAKTFEYDPNEETLNKVFNKGGI